MSVCLLAGTDDMEIDVNGYHSHSDIGVIL